MTMPGVLAERTAPATLWLDPARPGRTRIGGAPEGHDACVLAELAHASPPGLLLHVAIDDARIARLVELLGFFAPELELLVFPAWDCLPYDRVSPRPDIVGRRIDTLTRLLEPRRGDGLPPRVVLTTVNAVLQRVPPPEAFAGGSLTAAVGERVELDALQAFLARNGYTRAQTVREAGEFAVRGGIVDLFPPGAEEPVRLDLFGDEIEAIRRFDPMSQRTTGTQDRFALKPMNELFLDEASINRFRVGYRQLFGAVTGDDPLYEAVTAGRRHAGVEHWLPLFHERMATLLDYVPDAIVSLDHQAEQARDTRIGQIVDFFEARQTLRTAEKKADNPVYKPLPIDRLYLDAGEWEQRLSGFPAAELSPFAPPATGEGVADARGRKGRDFTEARNSPEQNVFDAVSAHARELARDGRKVVVAGYSAGARARLQGLLEAHGQLDLAPAGDWPEILRQDRKRIAAAVLPLEAGFQAPDLAVVTEQDILGDRLTRPARKRRRADNFIAEVSALNPGDLVVHADHGIGRYEGLETLTVSGAPHDCLRLVYADRDKLFVPVENIEVLSRYGSEEAGAVLDKLGGPGWQARKARVKKKLKDMADELLRVAAARELRRTDSVAPEAGLYEEFAARFPYPETDDQLNAIEDVLADLRSGRAMDRLVCGDVGFGKTEVALRAAFVTASAGAQVAVVVPTTLLARQHHRTFVERFRGLPLRVAQLSRMVSARDAREVRQGLADGSIDMVVGTHALLSKSVSFANLQLLIVDEEQHFGVKQKERLKQLRENVHVLTLTATPIPRTLQLALSGVRELSLIATPPVDRLAVRTFVLPYDPVIVREAILREHFRGGQTFYVCPRIEDLPKLSEALRELVPEVKIVVAHGKLGATQMEEIMAAFYDGQFDVLLSTSIVESGLDVPSANTLIVHRADMFGLSQLYQLRGRIGRSKVRGYAYFTYPQRQALSQTAQQRLHVIETLDSLGAGFSLASHDMDIRGAGNLLGEEQSGHIREVGLELFQQMLEEAVAAARRGELPEGAPETWTPTINLGIPVLIPEDFVADLHVRLELYRRLSRLESQADIDGFAAEMIDRFGPLPPEVENLLTLIGLKGLCKTAGIEKLDSGPRGAVVTFRQNAFARPEKLLDFIQRRPNSVKLRPDHRLVYSRDWEDGAKRIRETRKLAEILAKMAA